MKLPLSTKELRALSKVLASGRRVKGWHRQKSTYRVLDVFYNKKLGIVLKKQHFILDHRTPKKVRIPTKKIGNKWVVQPIAFKVDSKRAQSIIKKHLESTPHIFPDIHSCNVGWYKGKPYLFDW